MLADFSVFIYKEEVNTAYGIKLQDAIKVCEWLHSQFRVVEKLHHDVILGFDWLQSVNPQVDWVHNGFTLKNGFVAAGIPVYCTVKVDQHSFQVLMHLLNANRLENSQLTLLNRVQSSKG